ncbi:MAG TPA: hypothetical protein VN247_05270 [Arenimonas sp.]|nr:hypothetical protein [Arenimonas sp.]
MNPRKIFDTGLDVYGHMVFGRIALFAIIIIISLLGMTIKGVGNVVDMTRTQGIDLFDPQYVIGDFKGNCQTLIDSDYNVVEVRSYESWKGPSNCVDYSKSKVTRMILVFEHQLAASHGLFDTIVIHLAAFIFFILYALHATTPSSLVAGTPKITPRSLCVTWVVIAIFLFPFTFRQHKSIGEFEWDGVEYTSYTLYTDKDGRKFSCPTPFFAKLQETKCNPYKW